MEIEATNSENKPECIFPSQSTVTDATYPLAHQLLLTVNLKTMKEAEVSQFLDFVLSESQEAATAPRRWSRCRTKSRTPSSPGCTAKSPLTSSTTRPRGSPTTKSAVAEGETS